MANTKSAAKRARQTERRTLENRRVTSAIKTQVKKVRTDVGEAKKDDATVGMSKASSMLDKAVKSGRIHCNAANRQKSRLNKAVAAIA